MKLEIDNPTTGELRNFGLVSALIIITLFGVFLPWIFSRAFPYWPWLIAAGLGSCSWLYPRGLTGIYRVWMRFGHVAGWINTRIILTLLFYLMVLPMGLLMKLTGHDPMKRRFDNTLKSYRIRRDQHSTSDLEKPY